MNRTHLALLLLLSGCMPAQEAQVAVDQCALKEYLEECDSDLATPEEQADCRRRAPKEATRVAAGIPPQCRGAPR